MECLGKKRKGVETDVDERSRLEIFWSHFSLEDYSRRTKKCKGGIAVSKIIDSGRSIVNGVATAPACGTAQLECPSRGLKRKIGCIEAATRLGRKKRIDHDYELDRTIGEGKFGSVVLSRSKATGEEFACKTLRKGEEIVHREVEIMQHLSGHPGVVTLKAVYEDAESFHLVMELCSGGRLLDQMAREGPYLEQRAANIIKELMLAVRYCHEMGVVHRDIKPENILLTASGQMKLADFGLAVRILDGQSLSGVVGSPAYVAPEVLVGNYSEKVDIWSAGVLLHALLVGVLPFRGNSLETMFEAIKEEKLDFSSGIWESVSRPACDLLSKMLTRDVSTRFTANEVLKHPWISFYTEPSLKTPTPESRAGRWTYSHRSDIERKRSTSTASTSSSLSNDSSPAILSRHSTQLAVEEEEDSGLVDVLAVAISRVKISEPKRTRICSPSRQECSSNLKTSNLCTAF
ncbi:serine/threonine-protein kinase PEPKR2-like [Andrographis paniculata]|uniref:serine/threonine-protein kinase PEPKR2-like n=1 Tax=Andrographis paniculata TaxID=175694 RepID=UPI0021E8B610|nr:serine/threonine-protein kinase PEPKR2-like [Andrographis paniculata]XP_051132845.1 serine/threonine-protein kinase PEPKR2-like [Andrographis paniculata]XP_051132846.1 serine/threonine-protein kinase PEPKR2-like [Andrographis paniculata]